MLVRVRTDIDRKKTDSLKYSDPNTILELGNNEALASDYTHAKCEHFFGNNILWSTMEYGVPRYKAHELCPEVMTISYFRQVRVSV